MAKAIAESPPRPYSATPTSLRSIELFSGAGGLALGTELAGFSHETLLERDSDACRTLQANVDHGGIPAISRWRVHQGDVRSFDFRPFEGVDLVAGGPPCQPFSIGGKHRGADDSRNLIPEFTRAIRELAPPAFMFENVRGLLRPGFRPYFEYVLEELRYPTLTRQLTESWAEHFERLQALRPTRGQLTYDVHFQALNAADHGVPQTRHRVFVVGFRSDLGVNFQFPTPTHSLNALLHDQWISGEYWERHNLSRPPIPASLTPRLQSLARTRSFDKPWMTVRDAIGDLPEPTSDDNLTFSNHRLQPGARPYVGHTGSEYDLPAKTLKAGDHGVPGGENMLRRQDGTVRYFTVREAARIQTFPDSWTFRGAWSEAMRQIGNAVPVQLAQVVGSVVGAHLKRA